MAIDLTVTAKFTYINLFAVSYSYGGFCPQFKYRIGKTFGKTTNQLLSEDDVASSGRLVLAQIFPNEEAASRAENARTSLLQSRDQSWGDQKLVETMVPGYTGTKVAWPEWVKDWAQGRKIADFILNSV